ncbi:hypothetical protein K435DRAFT_846517 [Dendrothele bispora CBS 962.96]|uniref:Uncharacterized protein n=1 Tax=Dendrothele bispora (strain CBS 962.96) TaxID=1314807 RepID=A0A4S8KM65_DENBC|nr:hypothetical protein K435DRAFT_846517 [Dendrothele bispora CBS 962.96]
MARVIPRYQAWSSPGTPSLSMLLEVSSLASSVKSLTGRVDGIRIAHNVGITEQNAMSVRIESNTATLQRIEQQLANLTSHVQQDSSSTRHSSDVSRKRRRSSSVSQSDDILVPNAIGRGAVSTDSTVMSSTTAIQPSVPIPVPIPVPTTAVPTRSVPPPAPAPPPFSNTLSVPSVRAVEYGVRVGPIVLSNFRGMNEAAMALLSVLRNRNRVSQQVRGRRGGPTSLIITWKSEAEAIRFFETWHEEQPAGYEQVSYLYYFCYPSTVTM